MPIFFVSVFPFLLQFFAAKWKQQPTHIKLLFCVILGSHIKKPYDKKISTVLGITIEGDIDNTIDDDIVFIVVLAAVVVNKKVLQAKKVREFNKKSVFSG